MLSPETYEMLLQSQASLPSSVTKVSSKDEVSLLDPAEKQALVNSSEKMKDVWNREDLSDYEKVQHFTNTGTPPLFFFPQGRKQNEPPLFLSQ